ncbi:MEDS domain-containing protein [Thermocrispum sp.]|uniref:MEDS domain-containing protein n=1 Tax=Thermocrispum agreste TaxID=37925 RepID=A0A2W4LMG1_9PSEU|nr:MEDS domain-containing protein [Thermocrispum sp.]PZM96886.1 MAG: hypothetical protein DIU77_10075 [Thermocrispum agreste]
MPGLDTNAAVLDGPGVHVTAGDHLCVFYRGLAERDEILIPYLRQGLLNGDKCLCVVDTTEPEAVLAALASDIDITASVADRTLDVRRSADTYLRGGAFSTEAMLEFWDEAIGGACAQGYAFTRAVGEMTWSLSGQPGVDELIAYEAELNRFLPRYPQAILCLYDLERFSGEVLMDVLKTHPKVILGGMLLSNPYYIDPDEFLAGRR